MNGLLHGWKKTFRMCPGISWYLWSCTFPPAFKKKLRYNTLDQDETVNTAALYKLLEGYNAHIISGHTHFNTNVCFNDSLMEHNTAAVCGTWWRADINVDGTPRGYGIYEVNGDQLKWIYKSAGYPLEHQFHAYPAGSSDEYTFPGNIIANVWNWMIFEGRMV